MAVVPPGTVLDRLWSLWGRPVASDEEMVMADDWSGGTPRPVNAWPLRESGVEITREEFDRLVASTRKDAP